MVKKLNCKIIHDRGENGLIQSPCNLFYMADYHAIAGDFAQK